MEKSWCYKFSKVELFSGSPGIKEPQYKCMGVISTCNRKSQASFMRVLTAQLSNTHIDVAPIIAVVNQSHQVAFSSYFLDCKMCSIEKMADLFCNGEFGMR